MEAIALWRARPHQWGEGRIHLIEPLSQPAKLLCGRLVDDVPGDPADGAANCRACLQQVEKRAEREARDREWEERRRQQEEQRQREQAEWNARYQQYLESPRWKKKRELVLGHAHGMCEGCGVRRATDVHHLTYDHCFDEFLWELKAVCRYCHERYHQKGAA